MTRTNDRHTHIMREHARRKAQRAAQAVQGPLAATLDALDATGVLAAAVAGAPESVRVYGPQTVRGVASVGVVVWYVGRGGFYSPPPLVLLGIWALDGGRVVVGVKRLAYSAATYNPESYHQLIRRGYTAYYQDDRTAPQTPLLAFTYDPAARLEARRQVAEVVRGYTP